MMYANDEFGNRIEPEPKLKGICSLCQEELISKCGEINIWHWAHKINSDCDFGKENETKWHRDWKTFVSKEEREVVVNGFDNYNLMSKKIADVKTKQGLVIEFQHSPIEINEIKIREAVYRNMIWVFDVQDILQSFKLLDKEKKYYVTNDLLHRGYVSFRWKWGRKSYEECSKPIFLDLGDDRILYIKKIYYGKYVGGYGYIVSKEAFIQKYMRN